MVIDNVIYPTNTNYQPKAAHHVYANKTITQRTEEEQVNATGYYAWQQVKNEAPHIYKPKRPFRWGHVTPRGVHGQTDKNNITAVTKNSDELIHYAERKIIALKRHFSFNEITMTPTVIEIPSRKKKGGSF
jgi:hypothetical protein